MKQRLAAVLLGFFLFPALAGAAGGLGRIQTIANRIMDWMYTFALVTGIIFIIYAAFVYITSGGDAKRVDDAKKGLTYAVIGIAIAVVAKGVPSIVTSLLGE